MESVISTNNSLHDIPLELLEQVEGICLDIDDTLSTDGKLTADAYRSLWALQDVGVLVVPVTGRPAGWCDLIGRFWPVHAVVGENGAFSFYMKHGKLHRIDSQEQSVRERNRIALEDLKAAVLKRFPKAKWASDQAYREYDLAIDFCEDVEAWDKSEVDELVKLCHKRGAQAKVSSIHVNAWFGDYDKKFGFNELLVQNPLGWTATQRNLKHWIYIGDSPNDVPMFQFFENSVGVANIKKFWNQLEHHPKWLTPSRSGLGFSELAQRIVNARVF